MLRGALPDPSHAPELPPSSATVGPATTSNAAIAAVTSALVCPAFGGLMALVLGVAARGEIRNSHGRLTGGALATVGIVLGVVNLSLSALALIGVIAALDAPKRPAAPSPGPLATLPSAPLVPAPSSASPDAGNAGPARGNRSLDESTITTTVGSLTLVDVGPGSTSLAAELDGVVQAAAAAGQRVVVWVVWPGCEPCNGVALALADERMQRALQGVRLVRVDATEFGRDLGRLGIPTNPVPGFALLGPRHRPTDYVDGGEWDEDIAANIAPVLGGFVRGSYSKRRRPWRGGHRPDETPI